MRRASLLLIVLLAACTKSSAVQPPVLTLLPAAFEGGTAGSGERCLAPGEAATVSLYVHEPSVTFTVRGTSPSGSLLEAALGPQSLERRDVPSGDAELTYQASPPSGVQTLRLSAAAGGGSFCLTEVAMRQP